MEYLKLFGTQSEYEAYMTGGEVVLPNVSLCEQENKVHYIVQVPESDVITVETSGLNINNNLLSLDSNHYSEGETAFSLLFSKGGQSISPTSVTLVSNALSSVTIIEGNTTTGSVPELEDSEGEGISFSYYLGSNSLYGTNTSSYDFDVGSKEDFYVSEIIVDGKTYTKFNYVR